MKRFFTFILLMICFSIGNVHAAYLRDIPVTVTQPDGTVLNCFASGDEYFNYLHDKDGYTIIQHPQTGYYVYAENRDGSLVATELVAGRIDPASKGLKPHALISPEEWIARRRAWEEAEKKPERQPKDRDITPNHGTLNNISIFIRFADDGQFTNSYTDIDNMFNDVSTGAVSLRAYFRAASYNAIEIPTTFYPGHSGTTIIPYTDIYSRSYYQPYNATTNPNGYQDDERAEREFSLLERAVNYVNSYYPVPTNLNIDYDNDGYIDNVCFIVKGDVGGWSSLLWPHKWFLYDRDVYINGKIVGTFNFQLADATGYFNTSTMCHEMNHSLGAPDLYHYSYTGPTPVGTWDLMEYNSTPPQHCGAYMKMKYGHWIDEIPEITTPGTYTLNPISSSTPTNVAYKIPTSDPDQFYVVEYRDNTSLFETAIPGSGLLVYRINTSFEGNASYDPDNGIYDEVYIFRPGGSSSEEGDLYSAHFGSHVNRTEFSSSTSAYPFFTDGTLDPNFRIYDITSAGETISFTYGGPNGQEGGIYIGDGGSTTNDVLPTYSFYNYVLTQQIYTAEEIGTAGTIHSIAFYNGGATKTRTCNFYLVSTDKATFESNTDWVPVSDVNMVFSGSVTMTAGEWTTIDFDTPFAYDGISNLILVTDDNTGNYSGSPHMSCRVFNAPSQALRIYNDDNNYDPTSPTGYIGSVMNVKNQLIMQITAPSGETVIIGEEGTTNSIAIPSHSYYNYSFSQQIYTPEELGGSGIINSIGFYNDGPTKTRIYDFYLVPTDKVAFEANTDWVAVAETDKVFSGIVPMTGENWTTIVFDKPFVYDGTSNLVLVADDNTGSYTISPHMRCRTFGAPSQTLRVISDGTNYNPMTLEEYTGVILSVKNQIRMHVEDAGELFLIGDGGTTTNQYLPSHSYYNYALTQQIYTAEEIGGAGVISSIGFYNGSATKTRTYDFYLIATDKTAFESSTDWVAVTDDNKVFSGEVTMTAGGWTLIDFDRPFVYDGTSNLILVADDNTGSYTNSPHMRCRVFNAPSQALRIYGDGTDYDPSAPGEYGGTVVNIKNQIVMHIESIGELFVIGDGETTNSVYLPSFSYWKYSLSQQIYTPEEIGTNGVISSISFYNEGATKTRKYDFYLVTTSKTVFESSSDWVTVTEDNKVFSGEVTMRAGEWTLIEFDRPFVYDGTSNLILVADDNSGNYTNSPHMSCRTFSAPSQAIRIYSDNTDYDPSAPAGYGGTVMNMKNQIMMHIESAGDLFVIGDGGIATNVYLPSYSYWKYSLSEQIYNAEEIGTAGTIHSMAFYNGGATKTRKYDFYLVTTDKTMFTSGTDWVVATEDDKVFSGVVTMRAGEWNLIEFDKPFVYNGTSNLVLVADDNSGDWTNSPHMACRAFNTQGYQAIRIYSDDDDYDPGNPTGCYGTRHTLKNQMVFGIDPTPVRQTFALSQGWNWISTYIEITDPTEMLLALETAIVGYGQQIKNSNLSTEYDSEWGWFGDLDEVGFTNEEMIMVKTAAACTVTLEGALSNRSNHPITIYPGWNWIGYPCAVEMTLIQALGNFTPEPGDKVKNSEASSEYDLEWGWFGDLETFVPGQGYMYYSNSTSPKTLIFNSVR